MDKKALAKATDLCVKCGLCLPDCPTYRLSQHEAESPRGRLALIQAWSEERLPDSQALQSHIHHCLHCRSCEAVCPAKVPYGQIVDNFRSLTRTSPHHPPSTMRARLAKWGLEKPVFRKLAAPWLGNAKAAGASTGQQMLSSVTPRLKVGLFTGCTGDWLDAVTRDAILRLLHHLGVDVQIPPNALCCGAIDQHAGHMEKACLKSEQTLAAFDWDRLDAVVYFASGCGAQLMENISGSLLPVNRFMDISHFLMTMVPDEAWPDLRPMNATVLLHTPCTMRNMLKEDGWPVQLLARIPQLHVMALPSKGHCCGAAGMHMLEQPETAHRLRSSVLAQHKDTAIDMLLTSNPGCAMHFRQGFPRQLEVAHPVTLLARQLP